MWRRKGGQARRRKALRKLQAAAAGGLQWSCLLLDAPSVTSIGLLNPPQRKREIWRKKKKLSQPRRLAGQQVQLELLARDIKKINPSPSNHSA